MPYVKRGGMDVQPPPWMCEQEVHGYMFLLAADKDALQALCDRCLNAQLGGRLTYKPATLASPLFGHYVALTFQHFKGMHSISRHASNQGRHHYKEASFWVMASNGNDPTQMFIPYMFVNDWEMLAAGREIYGFPKEYGDVRMAGDGGANECLVAAPTVPTPQQPANVAWQTLLQCRPWGGANAFAGLAGTDGLWDTIMPLDAPEAFTNTLSPLGGFFDIIKILKQGTLPLVFLRQIRALAGGDGTDLQQIVKTQADPFVVTSLNVLGPHEITFAQSGSHDFVSELGLSAQHGVASSLLSLELSIKFGIQAGQVV